MKQFKTRILGTVALTVIFSVICYAFIPHTHEQKDEHLRGIIEEFDQYTKKTISEWKAPGAAVAIVGGDGTMILKGYGVREAGKKELITPKTVFRIASLSKGFTAELTALLEKQGVLELDAPIQNYLPDLDFSANPRLTLRNVLSHTSGYEAYEFTTPLESGIPFNRFIKEIAKTQPKHEPGEVYAYQNAIFCLAAKAIEHQTGKSYIECLKQNILDPLGMKQTTCTFRDFERAPNRATPHNRKEGKYIPQTLNSSYYEVAAAGGLNSSIADLGLWLKAQIGDFPEVISTDIRETVLKPQIDNGAEIMRAPWSKERLKQAAYGMGWRLFNYEEHFVVAHSGHVNGVRHFLAFDPHRKVGIAILVNSDTPISGILLAKFFDLYYKLPAKDWSALKLQSKKQVNLDGEIR